MKKIELNSDEFLKTVIDYMLRYYDADFKSVQKNPIIKGTSWFLYYWDTPETKKEFDEWLFQFIKTKVRYRHYKIKNIISTINFNYGLIEYPNENL